MQGHTRDIAKELAAARAASIRRRTKDRLRCRKNGLGKRKTLRAVQRLQKRRTAPSNPPGTKLLRRAFYVSNGFRGTAAQASEAYAQLAEPRFRAGESWERVAQGLGSP